MPRPLLYAFALALALVSGTAAPLAGQAAPALRGDVNQDGQITALDALAILSHTVGRPLPAGFRIMPNGDNNGDGQITAVDALIGLSYTVDRDVSQFPIGQPLPVLAAAVAVAPDSLALATGDTATLRATARDAAGTVLQGRSAAWSSTAPSVARVDSLGRVTALSAGTAIIRAVVDSASGEARVSVTAVATALQVVGGQGQEAPAGSALPQPLTVRVVDALGNPVAGVAVAWSPAQGGTAAPGTSTTDAAGNASTAWTLAPAAGAQQLTATAGTLSAQFTATATSAGLTLVKTAGDVAADTAGSAQGVTVEARDAAGRPVTGVAVSWTVVDGGGSVTPAESVTGTGGASATWTRGVAPGTQTLRAATASGATVVFSTTVTAGAPSQLVKSSGDGQRARVGQPLPAPLVARVVDRNGNGVANAAVAWTVVSGGGSVNGGTPTDSAGYTQASAVLGPQTGEQRFSVAAAGLAAVFTAQADSAVAASLSVLPETVRLGAYGDTARLIAEVRDSAGAPIAGKRITWLSRDVGIASVDSTGLVSATGLGVTWIVAQTGNLADSTYVNADLGGSLERLEVTPSADTVTVVGGTVQLTATVRDTSGNVIAVSGVVWTTVSGPGTVTQAGLVTTSGTGGSALVSARYGELADTATIVIAPVPARLVVSPDSVRVTADGDVVARPTSVLLDSLGTVLHTDPAGSPYDASIQWRTLDTAIAVVEADTASAYDGVRVVGRSAGVTYVVATFGSLADTAKVASVAPAPLTFRPESLTGEIGFCALSTRGDAWCTGTGTDGLVPGGHVWTDFSRGYDASCGVTTGGETYCQGTLPGAGATHTRLVANPGFTQVTVGRSFACGLTGSGQAFCWGRNNTGALGVGDLTARQSPTPVLGGRAYQRIVAGDNGTCAITLDGVGECWGTFRNLPQTSVPVVRVASNAVDVAAGRVHCFRLGSGGNTCGSFSAGVTPPTFVRMSGGGETTCAVDTEGRLWCVEFFNQIWDLRGSMDAGGVAVSYSQQPAIITRQGQWAAFPP
ncbi:Ig-like domain-containing protein [Longimicrobium sp.]|jgi:hypothetical protein|uniref:Ig-like domain-containing protein n=1 Tax=Longimicrobium sp. TaxID=2029185 RepID=UPI002EDA2C75